jgi:hypothetical protein
MQAPRSVDGIRERVRGGPMQKRTAPIPVNAGANTSARSVRRSPRSGCTRTRSRPATEARPGQIRPAMPSELSLPRAGDAMAMTTGVSARAMVRAPESRSRAARKRAVAGPPTSRAPAISQRAVAVCGGFGSETAAVLFGTRTARARSAAQAQPMVWVVRVDSASGRAAATAQRLAPKRTSKTKGHQRLTVDWLVWLDVIRCASPSLATRSRRMSQHRRFAKIKKPR